MPIHYGNSSVAYSRWEQVRNGGEEEEEDSTQLREFQRFDDDVGGGTSIERRNPSSWTKRIRIMGTIVVFGVGWILGFLIRWGVHRYYIDPSGHCVVPAPYAYNYESGQWAQGGIVHSNFRNTFFNFTSNHHRTGTPEARDFIQSIHRLWTDYGLDKVETESVPIRITKSSETIPNELSIYDANGTRVWTKTFTIEDGDKIAYSPGTIGEGLLVYGHYGQLADLKDLQGQGIPFSDSIVMIKTSSRYFAGSAVRNAEIFGAKGVLLFPDPYSYILTPGGDIGSVPKNSTQAHSIKFVPGDPNTPYMNVESTGVLNETLSKIPVMSMNYDEAEILLRHYVNGQNMTKNFWFGLPIMTNETRKFRARMIVNSDFKNVTVRNVIGVLTGRYEPTRYVIVGCHHDTWYQGAGKPGLGHSVLMELVRTFGMMRQHGWRPGRSIIFASWDGEELGSLGITSWINKHAKELDSRAIAYMDLNFLIQGKQKVHVSASPLLRSIIESSSKEVDKDTIGHHGGVNGTNHTLYWDSNDGSASMISDDNGSPFQSILGISSIKLSMMNDRPEDSYPFLKTIYDRPESVERYLDPGFKNSVLIGRFASVVIMKLSMSAQLPVRADDYAQDILRETNNFFRVYADKLSENGLESAIKDINNAVAIFHGSATKFHNHFQTRIPQMEFLEYHEFNDQLLELERSFLARTGFEGSDPFRHVIHGPSPVNSARVDFFPRLKASMDLAMKLNGNWNAVKREVFYLVHALEAASCILDNHLIYSVTEGHAVES